MNWPWFERNSGWMFVFTFTLLLILLAWMIKSNIRHAPIVGRSAIFMIDVIPDSEQTAEK